MANSLQEQLLKAGLVEKKQVRDFNKDRRKQEQYQRKHRIEVEDENKAQVQRSLEEKAERDRQLNFERDEQIRHKAIIAQIKQLIQTSRVSRDGADLPYNFKDGTTIKKILVTGPMLNQLSNGWLAIVKFDDKYEVVPKAVAEKIRQRDERYVIVSNTAQPTEDDADDPYAAYKVPDDLMW